MTDEEAKKVAGVLAEADGGCCVCAANLAATMESVFPGRDWFALVGEAGGWDGLRDDHEKGFP